MKIKIFFITMIAMVVAGLMTPKAFAAERITNVKTNVKVEKSGATSTENFELKFKIDDNVSNGDYFDIEISGITNHLNAQPIYYNNKKIGDLLKTETIPGANEIQSRDTIDSDFQNTNPSSNQIHKYRVVFNENIDNLQNLEFSFGVKNKGVSIAVANIDYNSKAYVKVNDVEVYAQEFRVVVVGSRTFFNQVYLSDMRTQNGNIYSVFGIVAKENLTGAKIELSLTENTMYKFKDSQTLTNTIGGSRFYLTESEINAYGLVHLKKTGEANLALKSVTDSTAVYSVESHDSENIWGYISPLIELTEEGKKYLIEKGKFPEVAFDVKITRKDGTIFKENKNQTKEIMVVGDFSSFTAGILKKDEPSEEEPTQEEPKEIETPKIEEEIKAPNTGFESGFLPVIAAGISSLTLATFVVRKKI